MSSRGIKAIIAAVVISSLMFAGLAYANPGHHASAVSHKKSHNKVINRALAAVVYHTKHNKKPVRVTVTGTTMLLGTDDSTATATALAHVHLRLKNAKNRTVQAVQSNRKGVFRFRNIKPGSYTVSLWARKAKFDSDKTGVTTITVSVASDGATTMQPNPLVIYLKKK